MFIFNFRFPLLIVIALFLSVLSPLKAADNLSGGAVLFDDEVSSAVNKSNENIKENKTNVSKAETPKKQGKVTKAVAPVTTDKKNGDLALPLRSFWGRRKTGRL